MSNARTQRKGPMLTQEKLRELVYYDQESGIMSWAFTDGFHKEGDEIGCINGLGYRQVGHRGRTYLVHRLVWLYIFGEYPKVIDHVNGDKADNSLANLRSVSSAINSQNFRSPMRHNKSGLLGAALISRSGTYQVTICINHKRIYLGRYKTAEEAHAVYVDAKRKLHKGNTL